MPADWDDFAQDDDYNQCVLNASPVVFLRMDEGSGNFVDSSGNGHDATVSASAGISYADTQLQERGTDAAPRLNSTGGTGNVVVSAGDSSDYVPAGAFTVECWWRVHALNGTAGAYAVLLSKYNPTNTTGWYVRLQKGTVAGRYSLVVTFRTDGKAATVTAGGSGGALALDTAYYGQFRRNPDGSLTYAIWTTNGLNVGGTGTATATSVATGSTSGHDLLIGTSDSGDGGSGVGVDLHVSHVALYGFALGDGMGQQHHAISFDPIAQYTDASSELVTTQPRLIRCYVVGTDDPYAAEPTDWGTVGFDDAAWPLAVCMTHNNVTGDVLAPGYDPGRATGLTAPLWPLRCWLTDDNLGEQPETKRLLFRIPITITQIPGTFSQFNINSDNDVDLFVNGTLVRSLHAPTFTWPNAVAPFPLNNGSLTPPAPWVVGANVIGLRVTNSGSNPASLAGPVGVLLSFLRSDIATVIGAYSWIQVW